MFPSERRNNSIEISHVLLTDRNTRNATISRPTPNISHIIKLILNFRFDLTSLFRSSPGNRRCSCDITIKSAPHFSAKSEKENKKEKTLKSRSHRCDAIIKSRCLLQSKAHLNSEPGMEIIARYREGRWSIFIAVQTLYFRVKPRILWAESTVELVWTFWRLPVWESDLIAVERTVLRVLYSFSTVNRCWQVCFEKDSIGD